MPIFSETVTLRNEEHNELEPVAWDAESSVPNATKTIANAIIAFVIGRK